MNVSAVAVPTVLPAPSLPPAKVRPCSSSISAACDDFTSHVLNLHHHDATPMIFLDTDTKN